MKPNEFTLVLHDLHDHPNDKFDLIHFMTTIQNHLGDWKCLSVIVKGIVPDTIIDYFIGSGLIFDHVIIYHVNNNINFLKYVREYQIQNCLLQISFINHIGGIQVEPQIYKEVNDILENENCKVRHLALYGFNFQINEGKQLLNTIIKVITQNNPIITNLELKHNNINDEQLLTIIKSYLFKRLTQVTLCVSDETLTLNGIAKGVAMSFFTIRQHILVVETKNEYVVNNTKFNLIFDSFTRSLPTSIYLAVKHESEIVDLIINIIINIINQHVKIYNEKVNQQIYDTLYPYVLRLFNIDFNTVNYTNMFDLSWNIRELFSRYMARGTIFALLEHKENKLVSIKKLPVDLIRKLNQFI